VAKPFVKGTAAEAGDVHIENPVVVEVGDSNSHTPALAGKTGLSRDVFELQVGFLTVQSYEWIAASAISLNRGTVHDCNSEPAVAFTVNEGDTATHRLDNVVLFLCRDVSDGQPGTIGNIFQTRRGRFGWRGFFLA